MTQSDENSDTGAERPASPETTQKDAGSDDAGQGVSLWPRILWMVVIAVMISLAQTLLFAVAVVQVLIMATSRGHPNAQLADAGTLIGDWVARAARFNAAASEEKPWPWTPLR
ncbi:MAG: DUF4389 domain-containing protein [Pararhodobacter sp.]